MDARPLFEKLTRLILTLNSTQKRNFKLYAKNYADQDTPRYIRLFDFLNKMTANLDMEGDLVEQAIRKGVVRVHESSQVANYLYYKILESMRRIPETHKARIEIVRILQDCRFLMSKELAEDASKELKKAADLLFQYDYPELELEMLLIERQMANTWNRERFDQKLIEIHQKVQTILERLQKDNEVYYQNINLLNCFVRSKPIPQDVIEASHRFILELKSDTLAFDIRYKMLLAVANYHRLSPPAPLPIPTFELVQPSKAEEYAHLVQLLNLMDQNRNLVKENPGNFLEILIRFLSTAIDLGQWKDFNDYSLQLDRYKNTVEFYRNSTYIFLLAFIKKGDFKLAEVYIKEHKIKEKLFQAQYLVRPSRLATICYYCAIVSLARKNAPEAAFWLEKIIAHKPMDSMPGLRSVAYFLRILVIANSPSLSNIHNTERMILSLKQWLSSWSFTGNVVEHSLQILDNLSLDNPNHTKALASLNQLKSSLTLDPKNEQYGMLAALAESYLLKTPFEDAVKPYI